MPMQGAERLQTTTMASPLSTLTPLNSLLPSLHACTYREKNMKVRIAHSRYLQLRNRCAYFLTFDSMDMAAAAGSGCSS